MLELDNFKNHAAEHKLHLQRIMIALCCILLMLLMLIIRLVYLQIYQHSKFVTLAKNNQVRMIPIEPSRGLIYDRNGVLLAENIPIHSLEFISTKTKNLQESLIKLAKIINLSESEIQALMKQARYKRHFDSIIVKSRLNEQELAKFAINKYLFPEFTVSARLARHYPLGKELAHAIGYIGQLSEQELKHSTLGKFRGIYQVGKTGIEKSAEELLRGKPGYSSVETDAKGHIIRELETTAPIPGKDLHVTIDAKLQQLAYSYLNERPGAIVAIEPATGEILLLASNPSFEPNLFAKGIDPAAYQSLQTAKQRPLFNRAISGQYPPGSTVKPIVALQALEHNLVAANTKIYDPGFYKLKDDDHLFRDWKKTGHGIINLENAIAESCTTYFYYLADKLGIDRLSEVLTRFGLGKAVGINMEEEAAGLVPSVGWKKKHKHMPWFPGETLITGIGQGYTLATPLQIAMMATTIANRGLQVVPTTTKSPTSLGTQLKLNNEDNWQVIINAMEKVVTSYKGTAHVIYTPKYSIAGKTGTAQLFSIKQDECYEEHKVQAHLRDHSWFMAFAPVKQPKIAIAVLLENSRGSSKVAKKIINAYLQGN